MKILVVDDSKTSLMITASYLENMGHEVITAFDPEAGIKLFQSIKPDLVILDVMMDKMDGFECARKIRETTGTSKEWVPIIFLSSLLDDESIAKGIQAGGDDYLGKPPSEMALAAKIKAMQRIADMQHELSSMTHALEKANARLSKLSLTDQLTGIPNRRAFDEKSHEIWYKQQNMTVAYIMLDIDHFKNYNDSLGHQAGDHCLRTIAIALEDQLDFKTESIYRYGGEEFIVILKNADIKKAAKIAENLKAAVEKLALRHPNNEASEHVTISLGVASTIINEENSTSQLQAEADEALYQAKDSGRNKVIVSSQ